MSQSSRRDAMKYAAGGLLAYLGTSAVGSSPLQAVPTGQGGERGATAEGAAQASAASQPSDDHQRVVAAGMTEEEATCWDAVADAAGKFFALPKLHSMDDHEVAQAIHIIQHKLLARPTYRKYLELAKAAAAEGAGG